MPTPDEPSSATVAPGEHSGRSWSRPSPVLALSAWTGTSPAMAVTSGSGHSRSWQRSALLSSTTAVRAAGPGQRQVALHAADVEVAGERGDEEGTVSTFAARTCSAMWLPPAVRPREKALVRGRTARRCGVRIVARLRVRASRRRRGSRRTRRPSRRKPRWRSTSSEAVGGHGAQRRRDPGRRRVRARAPPPHVRRSALAVGSPTVGGEVGRRRRGWRRYGAHPTRLSLPVRLAYCSARPKIQTPERDQDHGHDQQRPDVAHSSVIGDAVDEALRTPSRT